MSWLFGSGKQSPAGQADNKKAREQQISSLNERVPGIQKKSTDSSLYEVGIRAPPDGRRVMLRMFLPTKFPSERPVLQLLEQVTHQWVNQYMQVVGQPDLQKWNGASPPMIADVLLAVISEFDRVSSAKSASGRPDYSRWGGQTAQSVGFTTMPTTGSTAHTHVPLPPRSGGSDIGTSFMDSHGRATTECPSATSSIAQGGVTDPRKSTSRRKLGDHTPIPAIPDKFNELQGMAISQLKRLLEDHVSRQALLLTMPSVMGMKELRTQVRQGNIDTAKVTLSKQEQALALRGEVEQMSGVLAELKISYEGKAEGRNKSLGGTADQVILKQVKHASKVVDTSSERVATDFLEKRLSVENFLDEFLKERQRYHMLAAKIECMKRDIHF